MSRKRCNCGATAIKHTKGGFRGCEYFQHHCANCHVAGECRGNACPPLGDLDMDHPISDPELAKKMAAETRARIAERIKPYQRRNVDGASLLRAELATLRAQLADAMKVVDAAMYFLASHGTANEEQDWRALSDAWIAYDRKQRAH